MIKKILVVEDEKILRDMYVEKLTKGGFKVFSTGDSQEAVELVKKEKPDLVLLDILLPKENGISLLGKMRKSPELKNTQVVAFSNYDDPQTRKEAKKLGVIGYLIKTNFTPKEIVEKIREYLK